MEDACCVFHLRQGRRFRYTTNNTKGTGIINDGKTNNSPTTASRPMQIRTIFMLRHASQCDFPVPDDGKEARLNNKTCSCPSNCCSSSRRSICLRQRYSSRDCWIRLSPTDGPMCPCPDGIGNGEEDSGGNGRFGCGCGQEPVKGEEPVDISSELLIV